MKDVLLYTPLDMFALDQYLYMPLGVLYISAYLSRAGYEVDVVHGTIDDIKPGYKFYGLSATTPQYNLIKAALSRIKDIQPDAKIIAGGLHFRAKTCIDEALKDDWDCVVSGDGEIAMLEIVSGKADISSRVLYATPIMDLDSLPLPDWDKLDTSKYNYHLRPHLRCASLITSRGCPNHCQYCCESNSVYRKHSIDRVLQEIDILKRVHNFDSFFILDDNFALNNRRFKNLLLQFKQLNFSWRSMIRAETVDLDTLDAVADSGCIEIGPGVESGSQKILDLVQKGSRVQENIKFIQRCKETGIVCHPSLMIGLPGESEETLLDTYQFMQESQPKAFTYSIFFPYPACPIYQKRDTLYKDSITIYPYTWDDSLFYFKEKAKCFVSTPSLTRDQIVDEYYKYYNIFADVTGFDPRKRGSGNG